MSTKRGKFVAGFTIVELLIALMVTGILLAAVAVAFNASVLSYCQNEDTFKAIHTARQAMFRITNHLRTADTVDPNSPSNECTMITAGGDDITYQYRSADSKLYLITNSDSQEYVLCDNVTAMTFTKTTDTYTEDAVVYVYVKSVQISITVKRGNVQQIVSAAAVIRRNLKQ